MSVREPQAQSLTAGGPIVLESATRGAGARTVLRNAPRPGARIAPHYHTRFAETFEVVAGRLNVWTEAGGATLCPGEHVTFQPFEVHWYLVPEHDTVVRMVLEPGCLDFERAAFALRGLRADNFAYLHESGTSEPLLTAALAELTNTLPAPGAGSGTPAFARTDLERVVEELVARYAAGE